MSQERELDFVVPSDGRTVKTWCKIVGDLHGGATPLVTIHGGPGMAHNYLLPLQQLWESHNIPVVLYDQIGSGKSSHLPEKLGDTSFWTVDLFCAELDNLLKQLGIESKYSLLGHSWGGIVATIFAARGQPGLQKIVSNSTPSSLDLWVKAANELRTQLPQDVQDTLTKHEAEETTGSEEYEAAVGEFMGRFVCRLSPPPDLFMQTIGSMKADPTVYLTMNGPSEFHVTGSIKHLSIIDHLSSVRQPVLLINGQYDEATDEVIRPQFNGLKRVKWITIENSSHLQMLEAPTRYLQEVGDFLQMTDWYSSPEMHYPDHN